MANTWLCVACNVPKPSKHFLPSPLSPTGRLDKCLDCIRRTAAEHRGEREGRAALAEAEGAERVEAARAIAQTRIAESRALTTRAAVRPLQARIEPHLFRAASRFIAEYQSGRPSMIETAMEPELRGLLLWLREQTLREAATPQSPEEIGRAILDYRDDRTARGICYGALWASLVRLAALYSTEDAPALKKLRSKKAS